MLTDTITLLVDDDPITILLHQRMLKKTGFINPLHISTNGQEALDFIGSCQNDQSFFVILDINMPVMNGLEFLSALQTLPVYPELKVFVVSSSLDIQEKQEALQSAFVVDFLSKPLIPRDYQRLKSEFDGV